MRWKCWKCMQNRAIECNYSNYLKYKMINFDDITDKNKRGNNANWPHVLDHPQNTNNWRLWIRNNKCVIKFNKPSNRY